MRYRYALTALSLSAALMLHTAAQAQQKLEISLTANGPVGLAPALLVPHDGSYDLFDIGGFATQGLEDSAEVGDNTQAIAEANMAGFNNATFFAPGGPFAPNGGTGTTELTIDNSETSLSFAAMVLPSNDWFIGTNNAIDVSSLIGAAPGTSITVPFFTVYDAGTEDEDFMYSPGNPLVGITTPATPGGGTETNDPIAAVTGPDPFAVFDNINPQGFDTSAIDFTATGGPIGTLTITAVPEPSTVVMSIVGLAIGIAAWRRRR